MARSVDLSRFAAAIGKLSSLSGKDSLTVLTAEMGKTLEIAVRYSPKADRKKIEEQVARRAQYDFDRGKSDAGTVYKTKAGKLWFRSPDGEQFFLIKDWHVPNAIWRHYLQALRRDVDDLKKTVDRRIREALAARGGTAKTWVQVGAALGVVVKAPAFVQNAAIPEGIGTGTAQASGKAATVTGGNASLVLIKTRTGQGMIDRAIRSRMKYIETSIKKGALATMESRTRAFPHLFPKG